MISAGGGNEDRLFRAICGLAGSRPIVGKLRKLHELLPPIIGLIARQPHYIFDPFFTSKRHKGGTGLGLAIARSLLDSYRCDLQLIASSQGAHFRVTCPVR